MAEVIPPSERVCERCGRRDVWNEQRMTWVADGDSGTAHCLHEWDINGTYSALKDGER